MAAASSVDGPPVSAEPQGGLSEHLARGIYGHLLDALRTARGKFDLQLPKIVVVGQESQGKSSVLERIAGCQVFPQGDGFTTRMPVVLKLRNCTAPEDTSVRLRIIHVDRGETEGGWDVVQSGKVARRDLATSIGDALETWVRSLPPDQQARGVFLYHELHVEITSPDVPTLDLIDLPGVISDPPDQAERTRAIVGRYLQDPHALVLAVFSAVENRLRNSGALPLIRAARLHQRVVAVLTMVDREGGTRDLASRMALLDDLPRDMGIVELIPVANSSSKSRIENTPQAVAAAEVRFFKRWCARNAGVKYDEQRFGISAVIRALDTMLHSYMKNHWVDSQLKAIATEDANLLHQMDALGTPPAQVNFMDIAKALLGGFDAVAASAKVADPNSATWKLLMPPLRLTLPANEPQRESVMARVERLAHLRKELHGFCDKLPGLIQTVCTDILNVIVVSIFQDGTLPLRLSRFAGMANMLVQHAAKAACAREQLETTSQQMRQRLIATLHAYPGDKASTEARQLQASLQAVAHECLLEGLVLPLKGVLRLQGMDGPGRVAHEDLETAAARQELNAKRQGLQDAKNLLTRLMQDVGQQ